MSKRAVFSTTNYEWAHGKKPRGFGRWAFISQETGEVRFVTETFSKAKIIVQKQAGFYDTYWEVGS
jgi:hypothetical protein